MIVGVDWGNFKVAICTPHGIEVFPSDIIPYRKIKVENAQRKYDFIFEYGERKGFAGTLARDERNALDIGRRGDTKFHEDALIRLLIALHQFGGTNVKVVVGQPIIRHATDKQHIRDLLQDRHIITVNGVTKEINITDVAVGVEGGSAIAGHPMKGRIHLVDIGSGTINLATLSNGTFLNGQSDTINKGVENANHDYEAIARAIEGKMIDLEWGNNVYLLGGGAKFVQPYLNFPLFLPLFRGKEYPPELANVIGFYRIGESLWG